MSILTFGCPPVQDYLKALLKSSAFDPQDEEGYGKLVITEDGKLVLHLPDGTDYTFSPYPPSSTDLGNLLWLTLALMMGPSWLDGGDAGSLHQIEFEGQGALAPNFLDIDGCCEHEWIVDGGGP